MEIFDYEFIRNALFAGLLASVVCGIVGTLVVVRRIVFIGGSISHASFGGVGLGYLLGFNPILGAALFSLLSAMGIGLISRKAQEREDTVIGMFWAAGMAFGFLLIGLKSGYTPDLLGFLFGSIISVPTSDLLLILILDIFVVALVAVMYKELIAVAFDEEYSAISGLPVRAIYLIMLCIIALTVVILIKIVGVVLAIALLSIPAAISGKFMHNMRGMMGLSVILSAIFIVSGLWLSIELDIVSGATIILVSVIGYAIAALIKFRPSKERRRQLVSSES